MYVSNIYLFPFLIRYVEFFLQPVLDGLEGLVVFDARVEGDAKCRVHLLVEVGTRHYDLVVLETFK